MTENKYKVPAELWDAMSEDERVAMNEIVEAARSRPPAMIPERYKAIMMKVVQKAFDLSPLAKEIRAVMKRAESERTVQGGSPCWHSWAHSSPLVARDYSVQANFPAVVRRRVLIGGPADGAEVFTDNFEWLVAQPLPITSLLKCDDPDYISKPGYIAHRYVARRGDPVRMDYAPPETKGTPA